MQKLLWNVYFWICFSLLSVIGLLILPFILLVNVLFLHRPLASALRMAIRLYGWILTRVIPFMAPVEVDYKTKDLPSSSIFVANHNSAIDPYLFGVIPVENGFVTSWPFKIPVYGLFMRLAGYANTEDGWEIVRGKCEKLLNSGCAVTIWPEGHRSRDGQLRRFKNGAFSLAVETGYPIVPVCIIGAGQVLPPGARMLSCGRIQLIVLPPVYAEVNGEDAAVRIRNLRRKVQALMKQTLKDNGHFHHA